MPDAINNVKMYTVLSIIPVHKYWPSKASLVGVIHKTKKASNKISEFGKRKFR